MLPRRPPVQAPRQPLIILLNEVLYSSEPTTPSPPPRKGKDLHLGRGRPIHPLTTISMNPSSPQKPKPPRPPKRGLLRNLSPCWPCNERAKVYRRNKRLYSKLLQFRGLPRPALERKPSRRVRGRRNGRSMRPKPPKTRNNFRRGFGTSSGVNGFSPRSGCLIITLVWMVCRRDGAIDGSAYAYTPISNIFDSIIHSHPHVNTE